MRAGTAATAEEHHLRCSVYEIGQAGQIGVRRTHQREPRNDPVSGSVCGGIEGREITRQDDHRDAPLAHGVLHRGLQDARHLTGVGDELAVVAALAEELVGVGLLEVTDADLGTGDMRSDGQHGSHASVGIEQTIDEVQIARSAAPRTDGQLAGELRFGSGREGGRLLVANVNSLDLAAAMKSVGHRIEAVTYEPVNSLDAGLAQSLDQFFRHGSGHDLPSP